MKGIEKMEIKSLSIQKLVSMDGDEALEISITCITDGDFSGVLEAVQNICRGVGAELEPEKAAAEAPNKALGDEKPKRSRGRPRKTPDDELKEILEQPGEENGEDSAPTTRRRRSNKSESAEASEKKPRRSRGRPKKSNEEAEEQPKRSRRSSSKSEEAEDKPRRSRRGSKKSNTAADDDTITDADLTKAASACADAVGPKAVRSVMEAFNVDHVNEVQQQARQEFLDDLQAEIDEIPL